jgi:hypothetical protein
MKVEMGSIQGTDVLLARFTQSLQSLYAPLQSLLRRFSLLYSSQKVFVE